MRNVEYVARSTQLAFSGVWFDGISWGFGYQTVMQFNLRGGEARPQTGSDRRVIKAKFEQISFIGEVFRGEVAVGDDSDLWSKLSDGWQGRQASSE